MILGFFGDTIVNNNIENIPTIQASTANAQVTITISNINVSDAGMYMSITRGNSVVRSSVILVLTIK